MYATHLKQTTTGQVFAYDNELAQRADMVPCDLDPRLAPGASSDAVDQAPATRKEDILREQLEQRQIRLYEARQRVAREAQQARQELDALQAGQSALLLSFAFGQATVADITQAQARRTTLETMLADMPTIEALLRREDAQICGRLGNQVQSLERYRAIYETIKKELQQEYSDKRADDLRLYAQDIEEGADAEAFIQGLRLAQAS